MVIVSGQEVAAYWYSACRQYNYFKEPDVLHANVNAGKSNMPIDKTLLIAYSQCIMRTLEDHFAVRALRQRKKKTVKSVLLFSSSRPLYATGMGLDPILRSRESSFSIGQARRGGNIPARRQY